MEMKRLRASFHFSPDSGFASSFPAAPFCVRPCLPKRWMADRMGPVHPLAHRARVTGSQVCPAPMRCPAPFAPTRLARDPPPGTEESGSA